LTSMKSWEELQLKDDFIFGKVMKDPELCRQMLERILDIAIDHIEYPEIQKTIDLDLESKGIRLDVYVKDSLGTVYNVEMQALNKDDLKKRSRYYQAMIDLDLLEKGEYYKNLNRSIIIFICNFDLFSQDRYVYSFENICQEDPNIKLGDGTTKIFLNAGGSIGKVSPELKAFLAYVRNQTVKDDTFVRKLDIAVHKAKENKKWRSEYMKMYIWQKEIERESREKGYAEGHAEGHAEGRAEGRAEGQTEGEVIKLISQIRKKIKKRLSPDEIADMLEEDIDPINKLSDLIKEFPKENDEAIYKRYYKTISDRQDRP